MTLSGCKNVYLKDGFLHADCKADDNSLKHSTFPLDSVLGNVNGAFCWGSKDWSKSARKVELTGCILYAELKVGRDGWIASSVDLTTHLENKNGVLKASGVPEFPPKRDGKPVAIDVAKSRASVEESLHSAASIMSRSSSTSSAATFSSFGSDSEASSATSVASVDTISEFKSESYSSSSVTVSTSLIESCREFRLNGAILEAICLPSGKRSSINLDEHIGVVCGELKWDAKHFSTECVSFRLEVTKTSILLIAECKYGYDQVTGKRVVRTSSLDLSLKIRNNNGILVFIAYDEKLSLMLSEVPWMKFRVIAEPDFSAIATNAVMQSTMSAIAQSTVQHVVAEMSTKLTFAIEEAMKAVMISAEKHIAISMQKMLVGVSSSAHIERSRTELAYLHLTNGHLVPSVPPVVPPPVILPPTPIPQPQPSLPQPVGKGALQYLGAFIVNPLDPSSSFPVGYDPTKEYNTVAQAMRGFGTDEIQLINALVPLSPIHTAAVADMYWKQEKKAMIDVIQGETSSYLRDGFRGLLLGPLGYDTELLFKAIEGKKVDETLVTEIIIGRTPREIELLKEEFRRVYKRDLVQMVEGKLTGKAKTLFTMALNLSLDLGKGLPVDQQQVIKDAEALSQASRGKMGTDETVFCDVLINRSKAHVTALIDYYDKKYKKLSKVIKSEMTGHLRDALLHVVRGLKPKRVVLGEGVVRDLKLLEATMAGFGTSDSLLVTRLIRAHWDTARFEAIKTAYNARYKWTLESRVAGELSGDYRNLMVRIVRN